MTRPIPSFRTEPVWWLHPGKLLLGFILPIYVFLVFFVPAVWPQLVVLRTHQYVQGKYAVLGALAVGAMGLGAMLGSHVEFRRRRVAVDHRISERFVLGFAVPIVAAYLIWFWPALARGQFFVPRDELNRIAGVTSFTQLGVPFVSCYVFLVWRSGQRVSRRVHAVFGLILCLTAARVYMWSERLALIEVGTPIAITFLAFTRPAGRWARGLHRATRRLGPFFGIPLLILFFGMTEFFRAWTSYSQATQMSFGDFVVSRLVTYYYTALNNGAGLLATSEWPTYHLLYTLEWFYNLPFGIGQVFWEAVNMPRWPHVQFLQTFGDPEFNNMSGIFPLIYDMGVAGGLAYFGGLGLIAGGLHRAYWKGEVVGVMFFPPAFVACLEILRIGYLNNTRTFLILVGSLIATTQFRSVARPAARAAVLSPAQLA